MENYLNNSDNSIETNNIKISKHSEINNTDVIFAIHKCGFTLMKKRILSDEKPIESVIREMNKEWNEYDFYLTKVISGKLTRLDISWIR